jgi:hypothetical protein
MLRKIFGTKREEVTGGWRKSEQGINGRIILKLMLKKQGVRM